MSKKVKIGKFESFSTFQWKEGIEIEIPDDMTVEEYMRDLCDRDQLEYEKLTEQMYDMDVSKETNGNEVYKFWYTEKEGDKEEYFDE